MGKVLFITEGQNDEVKYIERLFKTCNHIQKYEIIPYKTNIHNLANSLFKNGLIDEFLDIKQVLKEKTTDANTKEKLSQEFSDIILVFDFEPQEKNPHFDIIRQLLEYFNDSTENGKLYINYPMMQSYRHFNTLPDINFNNVKVSKEDANKYKQIIDSFSKFKNTTHHSYRLFVSITYHHLIKLNYILNNKNTLPPINFISEWQQIDLFDKQLSFLENNQDIFVINTFTLFLVEYNPKTYYQQVTKHKNKYLIF